MGKTLLVIGLGGIGSEIARRTHTFGMHVVATDAKVLERPLYVEEFHRPDAFLALPPRVIVAGPSLLSRGATTFPGAKEKSGARAPIARVVAGLHPVRRALEAKGEIGVRNRGRQSRSTNHAPPTR